MSDFFTEKQKNIIRMLKHGELKRLNILYGSVRSGKTWITLVVFALWVATMPIDKSFIMCAKTLTSLKRNCLDILQEIIGESNFKYSIAGKIGSLFGRKIYLEGANDARSESKIRGMTLQGAYVDEITLVERDFFAMLLSRLSEPNAKLFGSTNPDSPSHWLKTEYIDRVAELDMFVDKFGIDDNTFLDEEYVRQIKSEYTGVFYERFINGDFALAEGIIYPMYEDAIEEPPEVEFEKYVVSLDYGTMNAFAALIWGKYDGIWYALEEYYYSGRDTGIQKTDDEYGEALDKFVSGYPYGERIPVIIDPSAASFIALLRKKGNYKVIPADNSVADGIRETATAMKRGLIKFSPKCENWKKEAQGYVWDETSAEDRPVKEADHLMDATRYFVKTMRIAKRQTEYKSVWNKYTY